MDSLTESLEWADVVGLVPVWASKSGGKKPCKKLRFSQTDVVGCRCIEPAGNQSRKRHNRVITPHPGEAARLLGFPSLKLKVTAYIAPNVWYNVWRRSGAERCRNRGRRPS